MRNRPDHRRSQQLDFDKRMIGGEKITEMKAAEWSRALLAKTGDPYWRNLVSLTEELALPENQALAAWKISPIKET